MRRRPSGPGRWRVPRSEGPLRRSQADRMVAGIAGGISARMGIDVVVVRVALVLVSLGTSGGAVVAYVAAWLLVPPLGDDSAIAHRAISDRRGMALAAAVVSVLLAALLTLRALGTGFVASIVWPLPLSAAGLVLVWRSAGEEEGRWLRHLVEPVAELWAAPRRSRTAVLARACAGAALVAVGLGGLIRGHGAASLFGPVFGALLVLIGFAVVFGPWWLSLARELVNERRARLRAEERADMAARVHDSVLQTLALVQRSAGDPQRVVQLARSQEKELRSWLFEGRPPGLFDDAEVTTLALAVEVLEREVEAAHGVAVESVTVGDCPLDDELRCMLAAGREAAVNAAKWSGAPVVSVFAEVELERVSLFVRDRGKGFDPDAVGADRRGIAESIRARMARAGGAAVIRSAPGEGTEVELTVPLAGSSR
ncbi:MAG: PspC domain-containing protein [Acidimicrobiales bacterium]